MALVAEEHTTDNRGVENHHENWSIEFKSLPAHQTNLGFSFLGSELLEGRIQALIRPSVKISDLLGQIRNGS